MLIDAVDLMSGCTVMNCIAISFVYFYIMRRFYHSSIAIAVGAISPRSHGSFSNLNALSFSSKESHTSTHLSHLNRELTNGKIANKY